MDFEVKYEYLPVRTPLKGHVVHYVRVITNDGSDSAYHPAMCGRRPTRVNGILYVWNMPDEDTRATCKRCIERLPKDVKARLYPITHGVK